MWVGWEVVEMGCVFFFNDTATTEIYTLSLHDALPISLLSIHRWQLFVCDFWTNIFPFILKWEVI